MLEERAGGLHSSTATKSLWRGSSGRPHPLVLQMAAGRRAPKLRLVVVILASAVAATLAAVLNSGIVSGIPPKLDLNHLQVATATSHLNVDMPRSDSLVQRRGTPPADQRTLIYRAELLGRVIVSAPVLQRIEQRCNIPAGQLSGMGRITANVPIALVEPDSERRASDIRDSKAPYRMEMQSRPLAPIIDLYTQGPTVEGANCVADSAPIALEEYMKSLAAEQRFPMSQTARVQALGPARGGIANGGATFVIAFLTFITVFGLLFAGLLALSSLLQRRRRDDEPAAAHTAPPAPALPEPADNWPNTTRLLPWVFAAFLALIWLTPFNNIEMNVSLPVEVRLDRMVLPVLVVIWVLALGAGGRIAPRVRMTWVHLAIGGLLACAFLSVVTDARYLNQSLELQLALKKLPLIVSYATFFLIAASAIRRAEVQAFLSYTLGLAVIVALGMMFEFRMKYNVFWSMSDTLLPGFFSVNGMADGGVVDDIGRRLVRGPAEVPLEAVAMLSMALPIALIRVIGSKTWRQRLMYSFAIFVMMGAAFATYRKSALIVPASVVLGLAYFRRRELLKLAPLGMIVLIGVSAVAPGTIGPTIRQFTRSDATSLPTVSDRSSDYDAVRPDVWGHFALGRGWGTYNHESYRIIDSEILLRTLETGVIGLVVFLSVGITVIAVSRKTIAGRGPDAPIALVGALVAIAFMMAAFLFDELAFPHAAYIFVYMVGLTSVVLPTRRATRPPKEEPELPSVPDFPPDDVVQERLVPLR